MQGWVCVLGVLCLSGVLSVSQFRYHRGTFRRSDDCNICYADDCLVLDQARCDYYVETDNLLEKDDDFSFTSGNDELRKECDALIYDLIEKATSSGAPMECIPFVSRYTDCNKENVCVGCKSCTCNGDGKWKCSSTQQCHGKDSELNIDHRVLVMVLENMMDGGKGQKFKRSVTESPAEPLNVTTLSLEQMSEWLYGVKPLNQQEYSPTQSEVTQTTAAAVAAENGTVTTAMTEIATSSGITTTETTTELTTEITTNITTNVTTEITTEPTMSDSDYVAFDEVLRSIAVDNKSYSRRKLPLENELNNKTFDIDYMLMDDDNVTADNATLDELSYIINFMPDDVVTASTVDESTKIVIDLLETAARGPAYANDTQDYDMYNKDEDIASGFENTNDIIEYNAVNIMKREITENKIMNVTPAVTFIMNTTNSSYVAEDNAELTDTVLVPLNKIIIDKKKELDGLQRIKDNLLKHFKVDDVVTEENRIEQSPNNTFFSIYNLAVNPEPELDFRKTLKPSKFNLDMYTKKLKSDINEVIRDISTIQKFTNAALPDDLKNLIIAMKRYVYTNKIKDIQFDKVYSKKSKIDRRGMEQNFSRCVFISFKDCVIQIIETLDKDMPKSHALATLSPAARKILKSIIQSYYSDEYAAVGLRVHDPDYNMTNDLKEIGTKWQEMTARIMSSSPFVTLYRMKLLHFVLTMDVSKMNDALALVDFAHSRRMFPSLDNVSDDVLDKINKGLKAIHNKIQIIIRYYQKPKTLAKATVRPRAEEDTTKNSLVATIDTRKKKKRSFIKHIRSLLKSSKKDIADLLTRKVPKSEIVKQLARKKLDELSEKRYSEYQETMKRWQKNLDVAPRIKRSMADTFKARIKNIIPNYLRHKVSPRIKEKKKNATEIAERKANERNNKRKKRKNKRNTTTTTLKSSENVTPKNTTPTTRAMTSTDTTQQSTVTTATIPVSNTTTAKPTT